ncbi:MAG: putative ABC transporter permease [Evtepia gabavorous]
MDQFFSTFFLYSFLGFLIEVAYTRLCHHPKQDRKCLLFLPLCPVYGLGALAVLSLPALLLRRPLLVFLAGALVATLVEYVVAVFYEKGVGVRFWEYDQQPGNLLGGSAPYTRFSGGIVPVDRLWAAAAVLPSSGPDTPWADSNSFSSVRRGRPSLPLSSPSNREHRLPAVVPARPSCLPRTGIYVRAGLSRPVPVTAA